MRRIHSIRVRLSLVFLFLFVLVIVLGASSLESLSNFNRAAAQIRDRWLPSAQALGDLNNYTSDFRAAEASMLLASNPSEFANSQHDMQQLDGAVAAANDAYARIPHDPAERRTYARFRGEWSDYRSIVAHMSALTRGDGRAEAARLYATRSKTAYDAASDTLTVLTNWNVTGARAASLHSDDAYGRARKRIAMTIVLAGLLVAGAMAHVTKSISAPILDLAGRMHRLAANETTVPVGGTARRDEIGEMARAVVVFRNNAVDLAASRRGLTQHAQALQQRLAEEQRLARLQRNFVSMASHEFRTPLAIIDGHAQRLTSLRERLGPAEIAERAGKIRAAVRRVTQLIDNLIGSARMIDADVELYYRPADVDLSSVLREVCQLQRELAPKVPILETIERPLIIRADSNLLLQVFGNLVSNAVKYSPDGGVITVSAAQDSECVSVTVEDRGIGISAEDRQRIFERYFRGSNTTGIAGTGVGLYLVKMMIDLHGGAIEVQSREGQGSRFTVRLPVELHERHQSRAAERIPALNQC